MIPLDDPSNIDIIAEKVAQGECILFLGAGVHCPPPQNSIYTYGEDERPPVGRQLSEMLAQKCSFSARFPNESIGNLQRVSLYFEYKQGRNGLVEEIKGAVYNNKRPSAVVRGLSRLNFPLVITTNYDQLFEDALRMPQPIGPGKQPFISIYNKEGNEPTREYRGDPVSARPFVVKLHGDIETPESIVITDEDYIQFILRMSDNMPYNPVPFTLRYFFTKHSTLFIGYSLIDYNLRLLFKTLRWKIDEANFPPAYSVDLHPDPLIVDYFFNRSRYVTFIAEDVWSFVPRLYKKITGEEMPP